MLCIDHLVHLAKLVRSGTSPLGHMVSLCCTHPGPACVPCPLLQSGRLPPALLKLAARTPRGEDAGKLAEAALAAMLKQGSVAPPSLDPAPQHAAATADAAVTDANAVTDGGEHAVEGQHSGPGGEVSGGGRVGFAEDLNLIVDMDALDEVLPQEVGGGGAGADEEDDDDAWETAGREGGRKGGRRGGGVGGHNHHGGGGGFRGHGGHRGGGNAHGGHGRGGGGVARGGAGGGGAGGRGRRG